MQRILINMSQKLFLFVFFSFFCSLNIHAKQLSYNKKAVEDGYQFNYLWLDGEEQQQQMSFVLSNETLFSQLRGFKQYKYKVAQQKINKNIIKAWRKNPVKNASLTLKKQQGRFELFLSATTSDAYQKAQKKLNILQNQATAAYFEKHYYHRFSTYEGYDGIKPDHGRIANLFVDDFKTIKPLILKAVDIKNIRNATNYVLGFSQAIPYATLESRVTSSGAGFNPPAKVLWENQGDCDSKVTLTASILRSLMPRIKMVLVFIENHALIGINIEPQGDDTYIVFDEETFVLAEPTGPASLLLGTISPESEQAISNNMYSAEAFYQEK